jgi:gamma-glutamyltranspeptidase/glutathione hydrolase
MSKKTKGVIAAGHEKTAEAGMEILNQGGNAFDAAIASVLTACVVEPMLTSVGGGGFLLAHTHQRENILFDFFTQTPRSKKPQGELDFYPIDVDFGDATQQFHIGKGSIAVPGILAGLLQVHRRLGSLPLEAIAQPAIYYAKTGVVINDFQGKCLQILKPILLEQEETKHLYFSQGKLLEAGETLILADFAEALTHLVKKGIQDFYQGEIAQQIVHDLSSGGYLTLEDLQNYQVIERNPLKFNYRGYQLLTNPPPSSGGALIAFSLKLLSTLDLNQVEWGSAEHIDILTQVMSLTNESRKDGYDAHIYHPNIIAEFLGTAHLSKYQDLLHNRVNKWGSTTHISVIDQQGNAASVTTSNGEGSSYIIPRTGIMLNNMLGEEDLNPFGFHQWQCNQRISSMMAPTMVLTEGEPLFVLGSGGSNRIRTAIFQVISNLIDFKMPIEKAIDFPRLHWENQTLNLEPNLYPFSPDDFQLSIQTQILPWQEKNMFFGGVHGVGKNSDGQMEGAGDSRRSGVVVGF